MPVPITSRWNRRSDAGSIALALFFGVLCAWAVQTGPLDREGSPLLLTRLAIAAFGFLAVHAALLGCRYRARQRPHALVVAVCFSFLLFHQIDQRRVAREQAADCLKAAQMALLYYVRDHNDTLPARWDASFFEESLLSYSGTGYRFLDTNTLESFVWQNDLAGLPVRSLRPPNRIVLAYSPRVPNCIDAPLQVLYLSGDVRLLDTQAFQQVMREQSALISAARQRTASAVMP